MQRIEYIHHLLEAWAIWHLTGIDRPGGYSLPVYNVGRVSQTDDVRAGLRRIDYSQDCESLLTDQAIASLPDQLKVTVKMFYTYGGSQVDLVKKLHITRATLHARLCQADLRMFEWLENKRCRKK